jgi:3-hydroxyisobutyrate dehydrogenase
MGKNLFECGRPTLGLATKICNNYISGTIAIATSEGYNLAIRLGLNPMTFQKVLAVSTGGSWVNSNCNVSGKSGNPTSSCKFVPHER